MSHSTLLQHDLSLSRLVFKNSNELIDAHLQRGIAGLRGNECGGDGWTEYQHSLPATFTPMQ
eukprot:1160284-Pelagomonas_calceolata.AAC.3